MCRVQSRRGHWEPLKCIESVGDCDQIRFVSFKAHCGRDSGMGLEVRGEMRAYQSRGDPSGAGWGKVEAVKTGRRGGVWVLSGDHTATGEGLGARGCRGAARGSWTVTPSAYHWLQEVPFSNTGEGSGRGRRRQ